MNSKVHPQLILRPICWKIVPQRTHNQIIPPILDILRNRFHSHSGKLVEDMNPTTHDWWNIPHVILTLFTLGAEGVLPGRHIVSLLRVIKQFTHLIPGG
jgi:hypothetical protein